MHMFNEQLEQVEGDKNGWKSDKQEENQCLKYSVKYFKRRQYFKVYQIKSRLSLSWLMKKALCVLIPSHLFDFISQHPTACLLLFLKHIRLSPTSGQMCVVFVSSPGTSPPAPMYLREEQTTLHSLLQDCCQIPSNFEFHCIIRIKFCLGVKFSSKSNIWEVLKKINFAEMFSNYGKEKILHFTMCPLRGILT